MRGVRMTNDDRVRRGQMGQAMAEFAIAATVFFFILFGLLDLGRAVFEYNLIASSAREGARTAIVQAYSNSDVVNRVVASSAGFLSSGDATISGSRSCTAVPCPSVTVTVTHTFTLVTPLISNLVGNSLTMTASSTMVVER